jgi:transglutaminase-like putative cysteine protease
MFAMTASEPSYWRISALPRFDGNRWDVADNEVEGDGETLPARSSEAVPNEQQLVIAALDGPLVPVAPEPVSAAIISEDGGMSYVADSSALIKTENDLDEGDTFELTSAMPRFSADALRGTTSDDPPDAIFLALPDDLPPVIAQTAQQVTSAASTTFDRMVVLQDWFRTSFTYDTDIPDGHDSSAIVNFLENRVGYCEQFSGTFAAMARALGVPARVAVGFTQGEIRDDGAYHVLGRNAHAWPEVWFDGYGWVPFEPTPGRGMPGAEAYTGIEPDQDDGGQAETTTTTTTTLPPTTTTLAGQTPPPPSQTTTTLPPETTTTQPPLALDHSFSRGFPWLYVVSAVALLALIVALPELVRRWRRRRHGPITDPVHALLELWDRALRALGAMGFRGDPTQTPIEVSDRAASVFPGVAAPLHELAIVATAASFAPPDDVARIAASGWKAADHNGPHDWCETIESVAEDSLGLRARLRRYFTIWH